MKYDRIEVRLDAEHVKKLGELKAAYHASASEVVRRAIDEAWQDQEHARRKRALDAVLAFDGIEDMPDPEELKRQNEETYTRAIEESLSRSEDPFDSPDTD
jgi:Arc/MetJ-type ribon-helix-helix transcriptional regulator